MLRRPIIIALLCVLAAGARAQTPGHRILVVPFEDAGHEPRLHWLGEASAVLLADELNARGLGAITRAERVRAFEQLHLPPTASLSRATIIKVGELLGASEVVAGTFAVSGDQLTIGAHTIRIDVGRIEPDATERGPLPHLFTLFEQVAGRLYPDAPAADPAKREPRPPLDAFESYIKGLVAERPAAQAAFLETAIRQHPGYERAELALWNVRTDQDDDAAALAAVKDVPPASPRSRTARFLAGVSLLKLTRYDEAFDIFKALADDLPASSGTVKPGAPIFNNLGVVQLRRGGTPQTGTATYFLTKATDADPGDPDYQFNLGYAYVLEGNTDGAIYWLREAVRRKPTDADAHYVLAAALRASGSTVEAAREKELARQLSSRYEELERLAAADRLPVPRGLARIRTDMEDSHAARPEQSIVDSAQREQRDLALFHLDRGRRLFEREEDREALAELQRAVYLSPYEAPAHLLIGRIHLRGGRVKEAVDAFKISIWSEDTAAARIALAEAYLKVQKPAEARAQLERALALDPGSADARRLLAGIK
jgi:tetratricopeptide (TPR) repeat protein